MASDRCSQSKTSGQNWCSMRPDTAATIKCSRGKEKRLGIGERTVEI